MNKPSEHSEILTLMEAARYLHVSKSHLSNIINGKVRGLAPLRTRRVGRRILIKREWLEQWIDCPERVAASRW